MSTDLDTRPLAIHYYGGLCGGITQCYGLASAIEYFQKLEPTWTGEEGPFHPLRIRVKEAEDLRVDGEWFDRIRDRIDQVALGRQEDTLKEIDPEAYADAFGTHSWTAED